MKKIIIRLLSILTTLLCLFLNTERSFAQSTATCSELGYPSTVSLRDASGNPLISTKTGLDFNLNIDVPGITACAGGSYEITITTSDNLTPGTTPANYPYPFGPTGNSNEYENLTLIDANAGLGINVPFRFRPGVTCNDATGSFNVRIVLKCPGSPDKECNLKVKLKSSAQSYWTIEKKHYWGNLSGGAIIWEVIIKNTNPNPGIGDFNIGHGSITDNFPDGNIVSVTNGGSAIPIVLSNGGSTASWATGTILSTTSLVIYRVTTFSCKPPNTVVKNCIDYSFNLGKPVPMYYDCGLLISNSPVCDVVKLVGASNASAGFGKVLTHDVNTLNYAQGCEAEYTIAINNNGNIPLSSINVTDNFPSGITVTNMTIFGAGTNLDYSITTPGSTAVPAPPPPLNTGTNHSWTFTSGNGFPSGFSLTTTNGTLTGGTVNIRIKFNITAAAGTVVNNCAKINYTGNAGGWNNWCPGTVITPPGPGSAQSCAQFTVQQPKAVPGIRKCISSGQTSFNVGDLIPFRIVISNHGAGAFSASLSENLLGGGQNLAADLSSIQYYYGAAPFSPHSTTPSCISASGLTNQQPSWLQVTTQTTSNLVWNINNMPGICQLNQANYLVIEFNARVLPQSFGQYCNTAKLGQLSSTACYNIMRVGKITTSKIAEPLFAEPGQSFSYIITLKNEGSVALSNNQITDQLPECVTFKSTTAKKIAVNGAAVTITIGGSLPTVTFPGTILQPGESIELTINVTRKADDKSAQCCNQLAIGKAQTNDAGAQIITDDDGPACVKSSLCCDIKDMTVNLFSTIINNTIVPVFHISTGNIPVQELEISLIDYHVRYNNNSCKPMNIGNYFGHIQPFAGNHAGNYWNFNALPGLNGAGTFPLTSVVSPANNSLTWSSTTNPIQLNMNIPFSGLVALKFIAPNILNLECCKGEVFYCFKVRVKDVNCNVCEKIVCGSSIIPKKPLLKFKNATAEDQYSIQQLNEHDNSDESTDLFRLKQDPIKK